jgi:hypothetical protein
MSIREFEPNPLAVFNLRKVDFIPAHFESMSFDLKATEKVILDWIYTHTESRFYFGRNSKATITVAFEAHSELSFFALQLADFNITHYDF